MKDGDKYSYATITIDTHGYRIKANEKFSYPIDISTTSVAGLGEPVELMVFSQSNNPKNPWVHKSEINKVVRDRRAYNRGDTSCFILVYEAGKTEQEVLAMAYPQVLELLQILKGAYETLVKNAVQMIEALESNDKKADYICTQ